MNDIPVPHKRRERYRGTHPRKFTEKYKELNPELYAQEIAKIQESGKTPAGMHRPICVQEILAALSLHPGNIGVDATLGFGGHAREILQRITPGGKLFGLDVDTLELPRTEARLRYIGFSAEVFQTRQMNFAGILSLLSEVPQGFDFVLADLGLSSMQIDNPARGFTFKFEGPLDLRLNSQKGLTARELIAKLTIDELAQMLHQNADEPNALRLARAIIREKDNLQTTVDLAKVVKNTLKSYNGQVELKEIKKTTQRVFQAIRIAVNKEFQVLEEFLIRVPKALKPGGKLAILTFHSGEDRRVKKAFQEGFDNKIYSYISPTPVRPSAAEQRLNSRSSCAKLRVAVKA